MTLVETLLVIALGLSFGSFANVLIYRTPKNLSVLKPCSFCPACGNKIKSIHNIPLLSYLFLGGKCAYCGIKISPIYPTVELFSALIFVVVFTKGGFVLSSLLISIVFVLFLALSIIDIHHKEVSDSINLSALTIAIFHGAPDMIMVAESFKNALLLAGGFTLLRFYLSFVLKKEAMGEGDIILAGAFGAILGIKLSLLAMFLGSLLALPAALLLKKHTEQTPFIPFLALGTLISYLFGNHILHFLNI